MQIIYILSLLLFMTIISFFYKKIKLLGIINSIIQIIVSYLAISLCFDIVISKNPKFLFNFIYIDALGAFFIFLISISGVFSSLYSINYVLSEVKKKIITEKKAGLYFGLFNLFLFFMYFVVVINNLCLMWIAIEMTTLVSAFLVGFYDNKKSIEAAWKYLIICSFGVILAFLGTLLFYYTANIHGGIQNTGWLSLWTHAEKYDHNILKISFIFIIIGYGTKAGLFPMHTWLPDAHSQSPAPISALLSGVLLKIAMYCIIRFAIIVNKCIGPQFTSNLFILFGIFSLGVSAGFILLQKDLKRLLAYSSMEHLGIISIGLGFGSSLALYGALLHIFNHAMTKSLMFFGAGNITKKYNTNNISMITGVLQSLPFTGIIVFIGLFALAGSAPFSIFLSELMIIISGFQTKNYLISLFFILFTIIIFAGIIHRFSKMLLGKKPTNMTVFKEPLLEKFAFISLVFFIIYMGFQLPWILNELLQISVTIIQGK